MRIELSFKCGENEIQCSTDMEEKKFEKSGMISAAYRHGNHCHLLQFDKQGVTRRNDTTEIYQKNALNFGPSVSYIWDNVKYSFNISQDLAEKINQEVMDRYVFMFQTEENQIHKLLIGKDFKVYSVRPVEVIQ